MELDDFLGRANGGRVSPREQLAARALWARFPDRARRRAGLCSLLARTREEWDDLALTFDACYPAEAPAASASKPGGKRARRRAFVRGFLVLMGLTLLGVLLVLMGLFSQPPVRTPTPPPQQEQSQPPQPPQPIVKSSEPFGPPRPPPRVRVTFQVKEASAARTLPVQKARPLWPFAAALPLLVLGLRVLLLRPLGRRLRRREEAARDLRLLRQREEAVDHHLRRREAGAPHLELYRVPEHPRFSRAVLEDCALYLGRVFRAEHGVDLHVPATVQATLRAGGRMTPRFVPARSVRELLVLCDREVTSHPDHQSFLRVLEHWERLGVRVLRYSFQRHPVGLDDKRGTRVPLRDLTRRHPEAAVLLFSRRRHLSKRQHRWVRDLAAWPLKVWVDPDPLPPLREKRQVIRLLAEQGVARFPYTGAGLVGMARYLAADGVGLCPPPFVPLPEGPQVERSLELWAAAAALVPDPSWEQLEDLRIHLPEIAAGCPRAAQVHQLIARLHERAGEDVEGEAGDKLQMPRELEEELVDWAQREHPGFVAGVDALLLEHLREPPCRKEEDPFLYARWELKRASHLARRQGQWEEVAQVLEGPLAAEGKEILRAAAAAPGVAAGDRARVLVRIGDEVGLRWRDLLWGHRGVWLAAGLGALVSGVLPWVLLREAQVQVRVPADYEVERKEEPVAEPDPPKPESPKPEPPKPPVARREPRPPVDRALPAVVAARPDTAAPDPDMAPAPAQPLAATVSICDTCKPKMVQVPAGRGIWLAETEVTQAQYQKVMGTNPSYFKGDKRPVENVSWYDAIDYCNKLSEREGRTLCYKKREGEQVEWLKNCTGYRLPTEQEWEQAARAGQGDRFAGDDGKNDPEDYAWFGENAGNKTHSVGGKKANKWDLYDMSGNVWEWVWDKYSSSSGAWRVNRGGSFRNAPRILRVALRNGNSPGDRYASLGFRVARSLPSSL